MHDTAMRFGRLFFETYLPDGGLIIDIGAQDVNGSLRSVAPADSTYVGVDFAEGPGVDVVLTDPYSIPLDSGSADAVVTSSCFEHSEFFWLTFLEALRLLKPTGLLYINVPSNGIFHRWPVDCWRFYPDSGIALRNWARRNNMNVEMLESFIGLRDDGVFNDFVAVFLRDAEHAARYPDRIQSKTDFLNGRTGASEEILHHEQFPQESWRSVAARVTLGRFARLVGPFLPSMAKRRLR